MTFQFDVYKPLTEESAISLLKELHFFAENEHVTCREIGDGNLNLVFQMSTQGSTKKWILKQALPYAKVVGESWPLTLKRAKIESDALLQFAKFTPHLVPEVLYSNETLALTIMEDLSHLSIARTGLIKGESYPNLGKDIGTFLAHILFKTSDLGLSPTEKKEKAQQFSNPELCKITEDLVFTDPFFDHDTNDFEPELSEKVEQLWKEDELKLEVAKLKRLFLTNGDALIHGDLHTGSIFASEHETKIIDPEFAFYGPFGFDLGHFIANLLFNALRRPQAQTELFGFIYDTRETFSSVFTSLWKEDKNNPFLQVNGYLAYTLQTIWQDALGFAGCEMIRRTIGLAHVADLDTIEESELRIRTKETALDIGKSLILNRAEIKTVQDLHDFYIENNEFLGNNVRTV